MIYVVMLSVGLFFVISTAWTVGLVIDVLFKE